MKNDPRRKRRTFGPIDISEYIDAYLLFSSLRVIPEISEYRIMLSVDGENWFVSDDPFFSVKEGMDIKEPLNRVARFARIDYIGFDLVRDLPSDRTKENLREIAVHRLRGEPVFHGVMIYSANRGYTYASEIKL